MIQFFHKRNQSRFYHSAKILPQIGSEIIDERLGFLRIDFAQIVDAGHRIVDEVRTHLKHQDVDFLLSVFLCLRNNVFCLILKDLSEQDQRGDRGTEERKHQTIQDHLDDQSQKRDQNIGGKGRFLSFVETVPFSV